MPQHTEVWEKHNKHKIVISISHMSLTCPQWISLVPSNSEGRLTDLSCIFLFMQIISTVALLFFFGGPLCASRRPYLSLPGSPERFSQIWSSQANQSETWIPCLFFEDTIYIHSIIMYIYIRIFRIFLYPSWKRSYVRWRLCPRWGFLRWCSRHWLSDGKWTSGNSWKHIPTDWTHFGTTHFTKIEKRLGHEHTKNILGIIKTYIDISILSNIPYSVLFWKTIQRCFSEFLRSPTLLLEAGVFKASNSTRSAKFWKAEDANCFGWKGTKRKTW